MGKESQEQRLLHSHQRTLATAYYSLRACRDIASCAATQRGIAGHERLAESLAAAIAATEQSIINLAFCVADTQSEDTMPPIEKLTKPDVG